MGARPELRRVQSLQHGLHRPLAEVQTLPQPRRNPVRRLRSDSSLRPGRLPAPGLHHSRSLRQGCLANRRLDRRHLPKWCLRQCCFRQRVFHNSCLRTGCLRHPRRRHRPLGQGWFGNRCIRLRRSRLRNSLLKPGLRRLVDRLRWWYPQTLHQPRPTRRVRQIELLGLGLGLRNCDFGVVLEGFDEPLCWVTHLAFHQEGLQDLLRLARRCLR
mmetsp:Transcript_159730/g.512490  ORF Transcript_159730/g.512490 Transcript_159730/m.512490 type:complete len:214 (+) Transcript_159730:223-864(+)